MGLEDILNCNQLSRTTNLQYNSAFTFHAILDLFTAVHETYIIKNFLESFLTIVHNYYFFSKMSHALHYRLCIHSGSHLLNPIFKSKTVCGGYIMNIIRSMWVGFCSEG